MSINYNKGLNYTWYQKTSFSAANTTVGLSLTLAGLTGYSFVSSAFLKETILDAKWSQLDKTLTVYLSIEKEDRIPVTNLKKEGFSLRFLTSSWESGDFSFSRYFDSSYNMFLYKIQRASVASKPSLVSVTVTDTRGIRVVANSTVTQI